MKFYSIFRRVTSSGRFLPEIDGFRFLAIFSVLLYHMNGSIEEKNPHHYTGDTQLYGFSGFVHHGHYGVQLFFAISGFILAMPFIKHYRANAPKPLLKDYFLRRLTRLEPPYFLVMIGLFFYILLIQHTYPIQTLLPSLLASLTYTHNFFYGRDVLPMVNGVAWTLEIEVQFYIIAPFLSKFIFSISDTRKRRLLITVLALAFVVLQQIYRPPFVSLYDQAQFFLIGFLLADFYVVGTRNVELPQWLTAVAGIALIVGIFSFQPLKNADILVKLAWSIALPIMIFCLYYLTLFGAFWKKVFSTPFLTSVGGMCYSIYLIHNQVIAFGANYTLKLLGSTGNYAMDWTINAVILLTIALLCSSVLYLLVEKPCMNKNWYKRFLPSKKNTPSAASLMNAE